MLVGETGDRRHLAALQKLGWGRMFVTKTPQPYTGERWGFDNGAFRDWLAGRAFDGDRFLRRLERAYRAGTPYLAVAPDVVAGGLGSLEFSIKWLERLPESWPWFLAVQDGMGLSDVEPVIHLFAGIFMGGTDAFKATAPHWAALAHRHGKRFHYGRAGTFRKLRRAHDAGADSVDSALPIWKAERFAQFVRWFETLSKDGQLRIWPACAGSPLPG